MPYIQRQLSIAIGQTETVTQLFLFTHAEISNLKEGFVTKSSYIMNYSSKNQMMLTRINNTVDESVNLVNSITFPR